MDVEVPHANLPEVSRMVFIEVNAMMMLTTSITTASWMFAMFTNTSMTMGDMTTKLPGLFLVCAHVDIVAPEKISIYI